MCTVETKNNLNTSTIEKLQELIQINIDASSGMEEAAKQLGDPLLSETFQQMAGIRRANALELRDYVESNGDDPVTAGTYLAAMHRAWINLRAGLNGGDSYVVLCEAERGEMQIRNAYETVIRETAGSAMNDILLKQYARVKEGQKQIVQSREAYSHV